MSTQETVFGQVSSNAVLACTITSKVSPRRERLISASRSAELKGVEEMRMEASQPFVKQSWKKRRSVAAAMVGLMMLAYAEFLLINSNGLQGLLFLRCRAAAPAQC